MANYQRLLTNLRANDNKWVTLKGSEEGKGRRVLLDDQGNIIGGDVPKSVQGKPISNAFGKEQKKTSPAPVATKTNTQSSHLTSDEYLSKHQAKTPSEAISKALGVSKEHAKMMESAVDNFTGYEYPEIREAERAGKPNKDSEHLGMFIDKSPKWNRPAYRGVLMDKGMVNKLMSAKGQTIDMGGTSSWSSDKSMAELFSDPQKRDKVGVLFQVEKPGRATSVKHLSMNEHEDEVLVHKDQKYRVEDAKMGAKGVLIVTLKAH